jgi:hypothetical protein
MRFASAEAATEALNEFNGKPAEQQTIATLKGKLKLVEGDEETEYHKKRVSFSAVAILRIGNHKRWRTWTSFTSHGLLA